MRHFLIAIAFLLGTIALIPPAPARAGECFVGTVRVLQGTVTIKSGVFVRDNACMEESKTLTTIPGGAVVKTLGEWDGWYKVEYGGQRGWIYGTFISDISANDSGYDEYAAFESAHPSGATGTSAPPPSTESGSTLANRLKGYILLQVESRGEAWYLNPVDAARYYMKDGATAYQMLRSFGLGVSESDYAKIAAGNATLKSKLRGRIILRAQARGEAYYIHPKTLTVYYLKDGEEAYRIMRLYSLGITNADLAKIAAKEIPVR